MFQQPMDTQSNQDHVSEGVEDRVGDGQMNSESMRVLHGNGNVRTDIGGKLLFAWVPGPLK